MDFQNSMATLVVIGCSPHIQQQAAAISCVKCYTFALDAAAFGLHPVVLGILMSPS